ncbi:MAG TPA: saccharopine dehydrogenase NADP-binding domain-containing protein [Terriglobales bacterium]|nr:saccharopine dehydrogenase NADP-binding domain-containing protein [Terriglobales bacterium]
MSQRVLILGGYGNFGKRIARALTKSNIPVIIAGRSRDKAEALQRTLPAGMAEVAAFDVNQASDTRLGDLWPDLVINTCGPFQLNDYNVARTCIERGIDYVDLADGRDYVAGFSTLDALAKSRNVLAVTGASTVPGLSSAVLDDWHGDFAAIETLKFGISPGQKSERGLATAQAILTYVGRPLKPFRSPKPMVYGWQDIYRQPYPGLGHRWMANCEVPDLDLLPARYNLKSIQFSAGMELRVVHFALWAMSWVVRAGIPIDFVRWAKPLLQLSDRLDGLGSGDGGMHIVVTGTGQDGRPLQRSWFIIAYNGDGPQIPTIPAIVLAKKILRRDLTIKGAVPCLGLVTLKEYLQELKPFQVQTFTV